MMTNAQYGKRTREREEKNRSFLRRITGKDGKGHNMNIERKARRGVSQFADITKPMSLADLSFIRQRLHKAAKEAFHRKWIGNQPSKTIRNLVVG